MRWMVDAIVRLEQALNPYRIAAGVAVGHAIGTLGASQAGTLLGVVSHCKAVS